MTELTQERLVEALSYSPETGEFRWRIGSRMAGKVAGTWITDGYRSIILDGRPYASHRLAWLYVHGEWPKELIDHINGVRDDNRISNLRECTGAENQQNSAPRRWRSLPLGVYKNGKKFQATITAMGVQYNLGVHATPEEAHQAYLKAKAVHHRFQPVLRDHH